METKTNVPAVLPEIVAKLKDIAGRKGNRAAAFAVLNRACHRATAGAGFALSIADLPDLPCIMNSADEIESIFEADWIGVCTVEQANEIAAEAVAELLAEEGFEMEGCE